MSVNGSSDREVGRPAYDVVFTDDGSSSLGALERTERRRVHEKLERIASNEFRVPRDWDYEQLGGCAEGRFRIGDGIRAFADIDDVDRVIQVHRVDRRENLYS